MKAQAGVRGARKPRTSEPLPCTGKERNGGDSDEHLEKIGIAEASVGDLDDEARRLLLGSRDPEAGTPLLLEPGSLEGLVAYLLELQSPGRGGPDYASCVLSSGFEQDGTSDVFPD